jgi:hypothetical protein
MNQINSRVILNTLVSSAVLSVKKSGLVRNHGPKFKSYL